MNKRTRIRRVQFVEPGRPLVAVEGLGILISTGREGLEAALSFDDAERLMLSLMLGLKEAAEAARADAYQRSIAATDERESAGNA